jgi:MGT family glycosyltransferase
MTRVLFACWPFEGHVFPQMSQAIALRERGAEVAFYTDGSMRELIEGQGFELFAFERVTPAWQRVYGREVGTGGRRDAVRLMREAREWMVGTIPNQVADLQDVIATWRPDVIGAEGSMWGPLLVLPELTDVPVALVSPLTGVGLPGPDAPVPGNLAPRDSARGRALRSLSGAVVRLATRRMIARIDAIRAEHGLRPMGGSVNEHFGRLPLYLVLSVPSLDYERGDLPANVHYVGACLWHPPEPPGTADWLETLPRDRPWVHVTEGTSRFGEPFLLSAASDGLAGTPLEAVLTTGRGREAQAIVPRSPNVHVRDWLSHDVLLPRCSAVVTTGGMGTVMAALRAGAPLVVVPTGWDKPATAQRVVVAEVGVRLSPRRCTPANLRAAVEQVLTDPRYRRNAERAADLLAAAPGPAGAAQLIEKLATTTVAGIPHETERAWT